MKEEETCGVSVDYGALGMTIVYDIWDSEFDGNDFSYTFHLDAENAKLFAGKVGGNTKEDMQQIIQDRFGKDYFASGLEDYFKNEGIHGTLNCFEDYPGGVQYERKF